MTKLLILVGGGGHCKSCIEVIETTSLQVKGIVDKESAGEVNGYKILGADSIIPQLIKEGHAFLVTVGQIKSAATRKDIFDKLKSLGAAFATLVSSNASVSKHATIGEGSIVMQNALVNASAAIGSNCIINNNALIEHDASIGDHSHISTGAIVNGGCRIGSAVFVGSGAVIANGVVIGDEVIIGAGAVVIRDITSPGVYAGNPARLIK